MAAPRAGAAAATAAGGGQPPTGRTAGRAAGPPAGGPQGSLGGSGNAGSAGSGEGGSAGSTRARGAAGAGRSRSSLLLLAMLAAGLVFATIVLVPSWWSSRSGLVDVEPQMLVVRPAAKGEVDLGGGLAVSLFDDGLRVRRGRHVIFQSVPLGSLLSAGRGTVSGRTERVSTTLDSLELSRLRRTPAGAEYSGRVFDRVASWPATIAVSRSGDRVSVAVSVPRATLLVVHSAREHVTVGVPPRLPALNLRERTWWVAPAPSLSLSGATFDTLLGSTIGVLSKAPTALDIRAAGRTDIHVWASSFTMTVTWYGPLRPGGELIRPA